MTLQDDLNRLQKQLGNFLFPRKCPFCGAVTGGRLLCGSCERTLPYTGEDALRQGTFGRCASPLYYTASVREAILRFKFQGHTGGLDCFGRLLAASLCVDWHVAPVETLRKAVDNPAQSGLTDAEHRRANVLGVYEALPENVRDKRLLLIDDIVTTGSTLTECVRVLREAGAADVVCLTLARTEEEH